MNPSPASIALIVNENNSFIKDSSGKSETLTLSGSNTYTTTGLPNTLTLSLNI